MMTISDSEDLKKNISEPINIGSSEATIQSLPFDVLRELFLTGWRGADFESRQQFIRLVSSTCQWWRNVALETPELWSSISVKLSKPHRCAVVTEHLRRSRQWPLHFQIEYDWDYWDYRNRVGFEVENSMVAEMMQLFAPHLWRWRVVELSFQHPSSFEVAFSYMHGEASILERFSFHAKLFQSTTIDPVFPLDFTAPAISSVALRGILFPRPWSPLLFRTLNVLRELTVTRNDDDDQDEDIDLAMFVNTISLLPNLTRLNMSRFISEPHFSHPAGILRRLTHVSFSDMQSNEISKFLDHVIAPKLKGICMTGTKGNPSGRFFEQIDFPENFPQLRHLVLNPTTTFRRLVLEILRAPFAQRLTLQFPAGNPSSDYFGDSNDENDCVVNNVLVHMSKPVSGDGEWLCPRLQSLDISAESVDPETLELLVGARLQASQSNLPLAPNAIQSLRVSVLQSGPWTVENRQCFAEHIPNFVFEV